MAYYPAMLKLKNKHAVVIGGGTIATRKIESLLTSEADVTVISPELTCELLECAATGLISWRKKYFEDNDIIGAFIVIAATNERAVNEQVYRAADFAQLINLVDQPELSNFTVPASIQRGKLTISVSTSGASPALAKKIKQEIAGQYDESYEDYLDFLDHSRKQIKRLTSDPSQRSELLKELLQPEYLNMTIQQEYRSREKTFNHLLKRRLNE